MSNKKANELVLSSRAHYEKMIAKGFLPGQIAITNIIVSINEYSHYKGTGTSAAIAMLTSCLSAIMSEKGFSINNISGYECSGKDNKEVKKKKNIKESQNIIYPDFGVNNEL